MTEHAISYDRVLAATRRYAGGFGRFSLSEAQYAIAGHLGYSPVDWLKRMVRKALEQLVVQGELVAYPRGTELPGGGTSLNREYRTPAMAAEDVQHAEAVRLTDVARKARLGEVYNRLIRLGFQPLSDRESDTVLAAAHWDQLLDLAEAGAAVRRPGGGPGQGTSWLQQAGRRYQTEDGSQLVEVDGYAYIWPGPGKLEVGDRVLLPENWLSPVKFGAGPFTGTVNALGITYNGELSRIIRKVVPS